MTPDEPLIDPVRADAIEMIAAHGRNPRDLARFLSELARELAEVNGRSTPEALQVLYTGLMDATFIEHRHEVREDRVPAASFDQMLGPLLSKSWYAYGVDREARNSGKRSPG